MSRGSRFNRKLSEMASKMGLESPKVEKMTQKFKKIGKIRFFVDFRGSIGVWREKNSSRKARQGREEALNGRNVQKASTPSIIQAICSFEVLL